MLYRRLYVSSIFKMKSVPTADTFSSEVFDEAQDCVVVRLINTSITQTFMYNVIGNKLGKEDKDKRKSLKYQRPLLGESFTKYSRICTSSLAA